MKSLLFVCLGNICRSPAAEAVMRAEFASRNLPDLPPIDSAGTSGFHAGEPADQRMRETAAARGIEITSHSRPVVPEDFSRFDWILAMDGDNLKRLREVAPTDQARQRIFAFCDFVDPALAPSDGIPDPYYGGSDGFEHVLDLLQNGCHHLADTLLATEKSS